MAFNQKQAGVELQVVHGPGATYVAHAPLASGLDLLFTGGDDYLVRALPTTASGELDERLFEGGSATLEEATAQISWLAADADFLVTAAEDACVRLYLLPNNAERTGPLRRVSRHENQHEPWGMEALLTRTTLPVRCAAIEPSPVHFTENEKSGQRQTAPRVAVCSDEMNVKLVSLLDPMDIQLLTGHTRAVRHAAWSPVAPVLITCSCDGTARIWDLSPASSASTSQGGSGSDGTPRCTQVIKDTLAVTRPQEWGRAAMACWHPSGKIFLLPSKTNEIVVFGPKAGSTAGGKVEYEKKSTFTATTAVHAGGGPSIDPPSGAVTAMAFSPNGRYLLSATAGNGELTLWEVATRRPIARRLAEADVTSVSWAPAANALAWTDIGGQLYRWEEPVPRGLASPFDISGGAQSAGTNGKAGERESMAQQEANLQGIVAERLAYNRAQAQAQGERDEFDDEFPDDDDLGLLDDEAGDGLGLDDDDDEDDDDEDGEGRHGDMLDDGLVGDFVVDDEDGAYSRAIRSEKGHKRRLALLNKRAARAMQRTALQPAFQPGATPFKNARRFLAFSAIGSLVAVDQESHQTILFETFDTAARRSYRLQDAHKFTMAALGFQGALFAAPAPASASASAADAATEPNPSSVVLYKPFDTMWGGATSEWSLELPAGESAVAVALGGIDRRPDDDENGLDASSTCALVATSAGYLRFFSSAGAPRYLWNLGERVVTMAAGQHTALVVYRDSAVALDGCQRLSYVLLDLQTFATFNQGRLPLPERTTLQWVGFTEFDAPAMYDSRGVLSYLDGGRAGLSAKWVPVLDTRTIAPAAAAAAAEGASEAAAAAAAELRYWPVGALNDKLLVIMLRAPHTFPDPTNARPIVQDLDLFLPVESSATGALRQHEEAFLRQSLQASLVRSRPFAMLDASQNPDAIETSADKALLQLIQACCKSDRHKRALDFARELHSDRTLDAALKIADYFRLPTLHERISDLREFIATRRDRLDEFGHVFAANVAVAPAARVLVPASQEAAVAAKRALTEPFAAPPGGAVSSGTTAAGSSIGMPRKSRAMLNGASGMTAATSVPNSSSVFASSAPGPRVASAADRMMLESSMLEDSLASTADLSPGKENADPLGLGLGRGLKRPSSDALPPAEKRSLSGSGSGSGSSNPFLKKPANGGPASSGNPFARQPGNISRDRSMHKSNSFFDRVDANDDAGTSASSNANKKQSTLLGFASKKPAAAAAPAKQQKKTKDAVVPAATPVFADTQMMDEAEAEEHETTAESAMERAFERDLDAEDSLQATLQAARSKEQDSVELEETQYENDEETQHVAAPPPAPQEDAEEAGEKPQTARMSEFDRASPLGHSVKQLPAKIASSQILLAPPHSNLQSSMLF